MFKRWATKYVPPERGWRAKLNLHENNDELAAREWWSEQIGVRLDDFTKTYVKPDGTGHRKNHLPFGVCTLYKRRSTDDYFMTMAWIEVLQARYGH